MSEIALLNNPERIIKDEIILFGTGSSGVDFFSLLRKLDIVPSYFCDSNSELSGTEIEGVLVISPDKLQSIYQKGKSIIVVCSVYLNEIIEKLYDLGIDDSDIFSKLSVSLSLRYLYFRDNDCRLKGWKNEIEMSEQLFEATGTDFSMGCDSTIDKRTMFQLIHTNRDCIFSFSSGKTGSSSIEASIDVKKYYTLHFHDFHLFFKANKFENVTEFWKQFQHLLGEKNLKVFIGIREPIARDISAFFQNLEVTKGCALDYSLSITDNLSNYLLNSIRDFEHLADKKMVLRQPEHVRLYSKNRKYGDQFDWFEVQIKKMFELDIFDKPFLKQRGYQIYEKDNIKFFVYQLEKLDNLESEISSFLEQPFQLKHANKSERKSYSRLYKDVMRNVVIPEEYIDFYYKSNPYMDYFYALEDREKFRKKWKERL